MGLSARTNIVTSLLTYVKWFKISKEKYDFCKLPASKACFDIYAFKMSSS